MVWINKFPLKREKSSVKTGDKGNRVNNTTLPLSSKNLKKMLDVIISI